eukprot:765923-Hanusia_phi.AAC.8
MEARAQQRVRGRGLRPEHDGAGTSGRPDQAGHHLHQELAPQTPRLTERQVEVRHQEFRAQLHPLAHRLRGVAAGPGRVCENPDLEVQAPLIHRPNHYVVPRLPFRRLNNKHLVQRAVPGPRLQKAASDCSDHLLLFI